ncbi:hypothetical protein AWB82_01487 [Caballeronia glebae]|uniref:Uncharacterized protein n=1 Tax=Caballeronia glebae TaxID=1777143 RepID=A0A158A072_9BURK|nr:hypothetical protein [Caballeronia glebae]SAK51076.1 hypothetical protein AWB82_01487 [Caballeronia glebae]
MNAVAQVQPPSAARPEIGIPPLHVSRGKPFTLLMLPMVAASLATTASLGIATYAGWQRGGTLVEQVMNVALGAVAVVYVHLLPMRRSALHVPSRAFASAVWGVSLVVVLYGQVTFFVVSQRHAGDKRVASAPALVAPSGTDLRPARTLAEIAPDFAKVSAEVARAEVRRCAVDCQTLKVRKMTLAAQLAALKTEADEAKRREAEEDRRNERVDRNESLRATLRADPVALTVASWLGTTESRLELILGVACTVVLEGAAIIGWLLVSVASGRTAVRVAVACDRKPVAQEHDATALEYDAMVGDRVAHADDHISVAPGHDASAGKNAGSPVTPHDDWLLEKIHEAVVAGRLKPKQETIRKFLRCGQPKAGSLNRQYFARFGNGHG